MVLTESTMLGLGTKAPNFNLQNIKNGELVKLSQFSNKKGLLVMFICAHCPYVKHVEKKIAELGNEYKGKDLGVVAICSNDPNYDPEDKPYGLKVQIDRAGFEFPYLHDPTQEIAKAYTAACTPDFFLFDKDLKLAYRGQLDDSRPENEIEVTGNDLRKAIDTVLEGKSPEGDQKPSVGCNIKWLPDNEPEY